MTSKLYKIHASGEWLTHRFVWSAATHFFDRADAESEGYLNLAAAALALTYFSMEGFLNYIGTLVCADIWSDERAFFSSGEYVGTLGKLDYIMGQLGLHIDRGSRPYQTLKALEGRRHRLVHPKPDAWDEVVTVSSPDEIERDPRYYEFGDIDFLRRARSDVEAMCDSIQQAARASGVRGLHSDKAFVGSLGMQGGSLLEMS